MIKKAYSYYCLDILHLGHIQMMRKCREVVGSDGILIAGILTDQAVMEKKREPILSFEERFEIACSLKFFDDVVPQEQYSPLKNLKKIKPNILFESSSHKKEDIVKLSNYIKVIKGEVIIVPYFDGQSSTKIKSMIKNNY
jgi:glycerol-3-phosphate cytidylyltransferase